MKVKKIKTNLYTPKRKFIVIALKKIKFRLLKRKLIVLLGKCK